VDASILQYKPLSGDFPEFTFDAVGNCVWVKFTDINFDEWIGIFGVGNGGPSKVLLNDNLGMAFVLSGGQGYWVNLNERTLLGKTRSNYLQDGIWPSGLEFAVVSDYTNIFFLSVAGIIWDSGRISWDGISFERGTANLVTGHLNDLSDVGRKYKLHIQSRHIEGAVEFDEGAA
jgi:hypothetical protein